MSTQCLRLICSWCGLVIRDGAEPVSHGICQPCADQMLKAPVTCSIGGCGGDAFAEGLCVDHARIVARLRASAEREQSLVQIHPAVVYHHFRPLPRRVVWGLFAAYVLAVVGLVVAIALGVRG